MTELPMPGLTGSNPLGWMAAVGTLRVSDRLWPEKEVRLFWTKREGGRWVAALSNAPVSSPGELSEALAAASVWVPIEDFAMLGNNLTVERPRFAEMTVQIARDVSPERRPLLDFLAAFGNEVFEDDKGRLEYTDLSFITGSGHQHFLGTCRKLQETTSAGHLREALEGPWQYRDDSQSFRWDPEDAKEYALRWGNPSRDGVRTVWGANRLAFEALPFFPVVPTSQGVRTTGFRTRSGAHEFTWPVWTTPAGVDTVRALAGLCALQDPTLNQTALNAMGIAEVFRAQRVRIGQGANFKVSFRPARSV